MTRKIFTTTALLLCFTVCLALTIDFTGKWKGNLTTPDGNVLPVTYNFKVDGTKLTGTAESPNGSTTIDNGKVDGNNFTFSVNVNGTDYNQKGKAYPDSCALDIDLGGQNVHFIVTKSK